jgi:hypothetical protein
MNFKSFNSIWIEFELNQMKIRKLHCATRIGHCGARPSPRSLSAWEPKQGRLLPPLTPATHRPIPASRRQVAGEGAIEGLAQHLRIQWGPVVWRGAHRSSLTTTRRTTATRTTATTQTRSHRRQRWGRRATTCSCVSPWSGGEAGGAWTTTGDGELIEEEATSEEVLRPKAIDVDSGLKLVLDKGEACARRKESEGGAPAIPTQDMTSQTMCVDGTK